MNIEFVNPFLEAIINVLSTMAQTEANPGKPYVKKGSIAKGDVTGIIGLVGEQAKGSLSITFAESTILHIAFKMLGEKIEKVDETIADVVGEITNMVTGGAKKILSEKGYKFDMAIPTTIMGKDHAIVHKTKGTIIVVPFKTNSGGFVVEVCFE